MLTRFPIALGLLCGAYLLVPPRATAADPQPPVPASYASKEDEALASRLEEFCKKGEFDKAIAEANEAIRLAPGQGKYFVYRAGCRMQMKEWGKAIGDYTEAIRLDRNDTYAHAYRALVRVTCEDEKYRDGRAAVEDALRACELSKWREPGCIVILYMSYHAAGRAEEATRWQKAASLSMWIAGFAKAGQFDDAMKWQKRLIDDTAYPQAVRNEWQVSLKLYEQKKVILLVGARVASGLFRLP